MGKNSRQIIISQLTCPHCFAKFGMGTIIADCVGDLQPQDVYEQSDSSAAPVQQQKDAISLAKERMYYLRDDRGVVGNCLSWWRKGKAGYTCNLDEAHIFTKEEAFRQHDCRETDRPYPKDYIDSIAYRHVDHQKVKK